MILARSSPRRLISTSASRIVCFPVPSSGRHWKADGVEGGQNPVRG
jgi:hypothetical protein